MIRHLAILVLAIAMDLVLSSVNGKLKPEKGIEELYGLFGKRMPAWVSAALTVIVPTAVTLSLCVLSAYISPVLGIVFQAVICWQLMGLSALWLQSTRVYRALQRGNLPAARRMAGSISGMEMENAVEEEVIKTILEQNVLSFPEKIFAPVLFVLIGGAPLAVLYFIIRRSGDRIKYFADWLPSKIGAFLLCICAPMSGMDGGNAFRIFMRDGDETGASCMAAVAGAMHLQLLAMASPGKVGNNDRPPEKRDIPKLNRYMFIAVLMLPAAAAMLNFIIR